MRDNQPEVSVLMTVYNGEEFLEEAIDSILNQTYKDFEFIVVVEKGCNEKTLQIVQRYHKADERMRLVYNTKRLGLAESLNVGIRVAKGKYIARMDDDDISYLTRLEKQLEVMENNLDIGVCGCLQKTIRPDSESILYCATESEELKAEMLFGCQLSHTSVMFRRQLFSDNNWFYDGTKMAEDYDLWTRILAHTKMVNVNEVLVGHRYGFGNISIEKGERLYFENIKSIKKTIEKYFGISTDSWMKEVFCPWRNFPDYLSEADIVELVLQSIDLAQALEKENKKNSFIVTSVFAEVLFRRVQWMFNKAKNIIPVREITEYIFNGEIDKSKSFEEIFLRRLFGLQETTLLYSKLRVCMKEKMMLTAGKKIIIYGLGKGFLRFVEQFPLDVIGGKYSVVGIMDAKEHGDIGDIPFIKQEKLEENEFDYILVTTGKYYEEIKEHLIVDLHVKETKIGLLEQIYLTICKA